jgi:DNA-binding CsgD family transcriptional regulator
MPAVPLIGRDAELARLRAALTRVAGGDPGIVLLCGLPGVGKTRLAHETLRAAETAGFAAFAGHCDRVGGLAYGPLVEAFGVPLRAMTEVRRGRLAGDLPQLGLLISGLGLSPPEPLGDPALERARLTEGFSRLIERLVRERPLALLVDDVHAADDATATLLRRLMADATGRPMLLICTARSGDPGSDRIDTLVDDLGAAALGVDRIDIEPLTGSEATALAGGLLGAPADKVLADLIADRCGGRPLLVQAVAWTLIENAAVVDRGGTLSLRPGADLPVPAGVQAQLRARLAGVTADEEALLRVLAIAGEADFDVLLAAAGLPHGRSLDALDRLHGRGLLAVTSPSRPYALAHGLLRDTLLADLSPTATQRAHGALVGALRAARGQQLRVADHVLAAGPIVAQDQALAHLQAGAARAQRLGLTEAMTRYLVAAAELARIREDTETLLPVLADLATSWQRLGEIDRAAESWSEAKAGYAERGDSFGVARTERELAMLAWTKGDLAGARERLDAAEQSLDGLEPASEHAWLLHTRVVAGVRLGDVDTVREAASRLRALAAELGSPSIAARAFLAEGALRYAETDYVAAADADQLGLKAAEASDEPLLGLRAHDQLAVVAGAQLDLASLREHSAKSVDLAQKLGSFSLAGWPRGRLAVVDLLCGDWDAALRANSELVTAVQQTGERRGLVSMLGMRAWILSCHGRLAAARETLAEAHQFAGEALRADRNIFAIVALSEVTLALADEDPARALDQRNVLEDLTSGWLPLLGLAGLGEASVRCGDLADGRRIATRLRDVRSCATAAPAVLGDWINGLADAAAGEPGPAAERLRSAAAGFEQLGLPFQGARARLAAAATESHDPCAADDGRAALAAFDRLGASLEAAQARALLRSLGVTPSRGRARRNTGNPLSRRELEVGRLVATGLSNADVASRLFISPRTVSTHLDRIYERLGLSSRAALTRYLADSGLLDEASPT